MALLNTKCSTGADLHGWHVATAATPVLANLILKIHKQWEVDQKQTKRLGTVPGAAGAYRIDNKADFPPRVSCCTRRPPTAYFPARCV